MCIKVYFSFREIFKRHTKEEDMPSNPIPSHPVKRFLDEPPLTPCKELFNKNQNR
jgi:hypothetical protein